MIQIETKTEVYERIKKEIYRNFKSIEAANILMDIDFLMDYRAREVVDELLKGAKDWKLRRVLIAKKNELSYE